MRNLKFYCPLCYCIMSFLSLTAQVKKPPEPTNTSDALIYNHNDQLNCKDITLSLDEHGFAKLNPWDIFHDQPAPTIYTYLSIDQVNFSCHDLGDNLVTLKTIDQKGNKNSCSSTVTVINTHPPDAYCDWVNLELDEHGVATVSPSDVVQVYNQNCDLAIELSQSDFCRRNVGANEVLVQLTNKAGNRSTCVATVFVEEYYPFTTTSDSIYLPPMRVSKLPIIFETDMAEINLDKLTVYPNPAKSEIYIVLFNNISCDEKQITVNLINRFGENSYSHSGKINQNYINLTDLEYLSSGIYMVYVKIDNEILTKQIVIE